MLMTMTKRSMTTRPFRPGAVTVAGVAALLLALAVTAGAEPGNDNRAPVLEGDCAKLRVEEGNKVVAHGFGIGVQIYRWTGTEWQFVAPVAVLYEDEGGEGEFATHFAGPTWQSHSGSTVVGAATKSCTPDPDSIPWLLLKATSSGGPGIFDGATFIQRVNTVGGKAPTEPGEVVGEEAEVPYTADYFFYRAQN
jgi:hypothetical protein